MAFSPKIVGGYQLTKITQRSFVLNIYDFDLELRIARKFFTTGDKLIYPVTMLCGITLAKSCKPKL